MELDLGLNGKSADILEEMGKRYDVPCIEHEMDGRLAVVLDLGVVSKKEYDEKEIGKEVAEASMGGLGTVEFSDESIKVFIPDHPAIATICSQLAGWAIDVSGRKALGSGPARIPARKPSSMIDALGYQERPDKAALILETSSLPDKETCRMILDKTNARKVLIAAFRGDSCIGIFNVLSRIVEVGIYRLQNLGYDIKKISWAQGMVPIPPGGPDLMCRANDAIIYQGSVSLVVDGWDEGLTQRTVSGSSPSYGKTFGELMEESGGDFYRIDPAIFAPAKMDIYDQKNRKKHTAGNIKTNI